MRRMSYTDKRMSYTDKAHELYRSLDELKDIVIGD